MRYRDAGVDLEKQRQIHREAEKALGGAVGSYVRWINLSNVEVTLHVDGVGTKTLWLLEAGKLETAGWDCVFVNVNDVVCDGFKTLAVVDYIALSPGVEEVGSEVLRGVAKAVEKVGAVLLGGETALMPDVVNGVDVVCTILAVREVSPKPPAVGDHIVGLASTGPHANGFSLLRRLFKLDESLCGASVSEVLLNPVADYTAVLTLMREGLAKAAAHITGGSFAKLKRVLGPLGAEIELVEKPCWVFEIMKRGVPPGEVYRVFNMGVGMALFTDAPLDLIKRAEDLGLRAFHIGEVKPGGVVRVDGLVIS